MTANLIKRLCGSALFAVALTSVAVGQVSQGGQVTPGHVPIWITNGVIGDGGTAASGNLTSLGVTNNGGPGICENSGPITGPYNQLCLGVSTSAPAALTLQNYNGAPNESLNFIINGITYPFPGSLTNITIGTTPVVGGSSGTCLYVNGSVVGQQACTLSSITALTGDVTATGPGSAPATLATVNSNVGTYGSGTDSAVVTVNGKGLVTAVGLAPITAAAGSLVGSTLPPNVTGSSLTSLGNLTSLNAGNTVLTGTLTAASLSTVGSIAGSLCATSAGLILYESGVNCESVAASALTGTTLASTVVSSSLTSLGNLTSLNAGNTVLTGTLTAGSLSTVGSIAGSLCATSAGLVLYESGVNCYAVSATSVTIGVTTVASGNAGYVLENNSGTLNNVTAASLLSAGSGILLTGTTTAGLAYAGDPGSITNCIIGATVSSNALIVSLLTQGGSTPSASSPCVVSFRNATQATGDYTYVQVTASTTFSTGTSGSTFGSSNGVPFRLWVTALNDSGTVVLGVSDQSTAGHIYPLNEGIVVSSTACSACTNATAAGTIYSTSAQSSVAMRILGYMEWGSGLTTAGTYASGPTSIQLMGPGVKKPGNLVQVVTATSTSGTTITGSSYAVTVPAVSITPTSSANLVKVFSNATIQNATSNNPIAGLYRASGGSSACTTAVTSTKQPQGAAGTVWPITIIAYDLPGSTGQQTYVVCEKSTSSGNVFYCPNSDTCLIEVDEIMGKLENEPANDNINPGIYSRVG